MMRHRLSSKVALKKLKQWEAITNLCLQLKALTYHRSKLSGLSLLSKILKDLSKEKKSYIQRNR